MAASLSSTGCSASWTATASATPSPSPGRRAGASQTESGSPKSRVMRVGAARTVTPSALRRVPHFADGPRAVIGHSPAECLDVTQCGPCHPRAQVAAPKMLQVTGAGPGHRLVSVLLNQLNIVEPEAAAPQPLAAAAGTRRRYRRPSLASLTSALSLRGASSCQTRFRAARRDAEECSSPCRGPSGSSCFPSRLAPSDRSRHRPTHPHSPAVLW